MNILVMGASGRVGRKVVDLLVAAGHTVFAGTHKEHTDLAVPTLAVSLTDDLASMQAALAGHDLDAIFQVAGSRGQNLLQVDAYGAVKLAQAAEALGINRFIMLSGFNVTKPNLWPDALRDFYIAKFFADEWLINQTKLNYTIIQPGYLTEEEGTGKVALNPDGAAADTAKNSIDNVAAVLAATLNEPKTYHQVITMTDGEQSIQQALQSL